MLVPVKWSFEQRSAFPIMEIWGKCPISNPYVELYLIKQATSYIQEATKYDGKPYPRVPEFESFQSLTVGFSLVFPDDKHLRKFLQEVRQEETS